MCQVALLGCGGNCDSHPPPFEVCCTGLAWNFLIGLGWKVCQGIPQGFFLQWKLWHGGILSRRVQRGFVQPSVESHDPELGLGKIWRFWKLNSMA